MTIRKTVQGAYEISAILTDDYGYEYLVRRQYMGYSRKEAVAAFKAEFFA